MNKRKKKIKVREKELRERAESDWSGQVLWNVHERNKQTKARKYSGGREKSRKAENRRKQLASQCQNIIITTLLLTLTDSHGHEFL